MNFLKHEKETREKLLDSAKKEFLEKGYMKANVRNICKNAEVTTGALYFFFQDKADLFVSIVKEPFEQILSQIHSHFSMEKECAESGMLAEDMHSDLEYLSKIVKIMYSYRDEIILILTKSQGSPYENAVDNLVDFMDSHNKMLADSQCDLLEIPRKSRSLIHWISHIQLEMFVYAVTHIEDEKNAILYLNDATKFQLSGWNGIFRQEF